VFELVQHRATTGGTRFALIYFRGSDPYQWEVATPWQSLVVLSGATEQSKTVLVERYATREVLID
jgi:hypothetical protein